MLCEILAVRTLALLRLGKLKEAAQAGRELAQQKNAVVHHLAVAMVALASAGRWAEAQRISFALKTRQPGYRVADFKRAMFRIQEDALVYFREHAQKLGI